MYNFFITIDRPRRRRSYLVDRKSNSLFGRNRGRLLRLTTFTGPIYSIRNSCSLILIFWKFFFTERKREKTTNQFYRNKDPHANCCCARKECKGTLQKKLWVSGDENVQSFEIIDLNFRFRRKIRVFVWRSYVFSVLVTKKGSFNTFSRGGIKPRCDLF